jgi:hypothetical protein
LNVSANFVHRAAVLFSTLLIGAVLGALWLSAVLGVFDTARLLAGAPVGLAQMLALAIGLGVTTVVLRVEGVIGRSRATNVPWGLLLLVCAGACMGAWLIVTLPNEPLSDFGRMDSAAKDAVSGGVWNFFTEYVDGIPRIVGHSHALLFKQRILFYLVPIYSLLGSSRFVYEPVNVAMYLLSGAMAYWYGRTVFESRVAAIATALLFFLGPGFYIHLLLPSHEISGLFYLALFLVVHVLLVRSLDQRLGWKSPALALLLGLALLGVQMSRSIAPFLIIALVLHTALVAAGYLRGGFAAIEWRRIGITILLVAVVPIGSYLIYSHYLCASCRMDRIARWTFLFSNVETTGLSWDAAEFFADSEELVDHRLMGEFAVGRAGSDLYYKPLAFAGVALNKIRRFGLIGLGDRTPIGGTDSQRERVQSEVDRWVLLEHTHRILLWMFAGVGVFILCGRDDAVKTWLLPVLISLGMIYGGILGQTQVRYAFGNLFALSVIAGAGAEGLLRISRMPRARVTRPLKQLGAALLAGTLIAAGAGVTFANLWPGSRYHLRDLHRPTIATEPERKRRKCLSGSRLSCRLVFPFGVWGRTTATWPIDVKPGKNQELQGILRVRMGMDPKIHIALSANEDEFLALPANSIGGVTLPKYHYSSRLFRVPLPETAQERLDLTLTIAIPKGALPVGGKQGIVVVEFVRIVEAGATQGVGDGEPSAGSTLK